MSLPSDPAWTPPSRKGAHAKPADGDEPDCEQMRLQGNAAMGQNQFAIAFDCYSVALRLINFGKKCTKAEKVRPRASTAIPPAPKHAELAEVGLFVG